MRVATPKKWIGAMALGTALLAGCSDPNATGPLVEGRWYTQSQVAAGNEQFQAHCAVCHKSDAQGTQNWKKRLADGSLPPPPINGTAHAWHHSMEVLLRTIDQGGVPLGGTMPAFKDKLSDSDKRAVIAFIQSFWSDEVYQVWTQRN